MPIQKRPHRPLRRPIHPVVKADAVNPSTSAVVERYAHDGFGREISAPSFASRISYFGFSTKQLDTETGMNYYGYRFYAADAGRWVNRDPIQEKGGMNVYAMTGNDVIDKCDVLGNVGWGTAGIVAAACMIPDTALLYYICATKTKSAGDTVYFWSPCARVATLEAQPFIIAACGGPGRLEWKITRKSRHGKCDCDFEMVIACYMTPGTGGGRPPEA